MERFESDSRPDQTIVWDVATLTAMRDLIVSTAAACARPPRFVFGVARHRREQVVETLDALIAHARQGWVVTRLPRRTIDDLTQLWRAARRRVRPEVTR